MKMKEVCSLTGLSDRTVRYYIEEGLIAPSYTENYAGRRSFLFSEEDVALLRDIGTLRKYGFSVSDISAIRQNKNRSPEIIKRLRDEKSHTLKSEADSVGALNQLNRLTPYSLSELAQALQSTDAPSAAPKIKKKKPLIPIVVGLSVTAAAAVVLSLCLFSSRDNGEKAWTGDAETYAHFPSYCVEDAMTESDQALKQYRDSRRTCGEFEITDFEDGVCINNYLGSAEGNAVVIPSQLDGKPVVKLGAHPVEEYNPDEMPQAFAGAFDGIQSDKTVTLVIPETVSVVSRYVADANRNNIYGFAEDNGFAFEIASDNPVYSSRDGCIFSKDGATLLYLSQQSNYTVPEQVVSFQPSNGINGSAPINIQLGKNVIEIDAEVFYDESGAADPFLCEIKGYRGTIAEKWAADNELPFLPLDES